MNFLIRREESGLGFRPDYMPDPGVLAYVTDLLYELGINTEELSTNELTRHWIPIGIMGALDWVMIDGAWLLLNTGIFQTDEPYKWIFDYDGYEFDPDQLWIFREDPEENLFQQRLYDPNITVSERRKGLQFIAQEYFVQWAQDKCKTPDEAQKFIPPIIFVECVMWATFMWVLSENGRDWIYMQDEVYACVFEFGVAYQSRWDGQLLDPNIMVKTQRELNTCRYCEEKLWCVRGGSVNKSWQYVCNNCLCSLAHELGATVEEQETRILHPACPHWEGVDGQCGSCASTCPHSGMNPQVMEEKLQDWGEQRLNLYREKVKEMGGRSPRQLAGQTVDSIVDYFG